MAEESGSGPNPIPKSEERRRARVVAGLRTAMIVGLCLLALSIWAFAREASLILAQPITSWNQDDTADCGVVLTGSPNRIREGVDLLARHSIQKLIISGVNPQAGFKDIFPHWPFYGELREEDIILERRSRTTWGNAQQTLPLVEALRCRDILLITSKVHMRRAINTFRAEYPAGFPILPRATISYTLRPGWVELSTETLKSLFYSLWAY